jgi:hypothetical protein
VKFQVFKEGKVLDEFTLCGAYLFGSDGITVRRSKITFKNGVIECQKPNIETSGLALLWPIEGYGKVLLPTTCLPERDRPYILNVEIARAKLMQIITKCEDWSFFNDMQELGDSYGQGQDLFIQAVQNISDPPFASRLADEALEKAVVFSEKLAMTQAESLFAARRQSHGFGRGCLGCQIDPMQITNKIYVENLTKLFASVTIPVNWAEIEPERGNYDFSQIDACVELLASKKLVLTAGPLLRFSKENLPKWLLEKKLSFEKIRENAYKFVSKIVSCYESTIRSWRVISGLNAFNYFGFSFEQILEMTRAANMAAKAGCDRALKIIEISNPWGEYYAQSSGTIPPLVYVDMVVQSGINFDAFGLPLQFGKNQAGMHVRDMMQISAVLDYFSPVGKPLYISDVEVPSQNNDGPCDVNFAGIWRGPWSQSQQKKWIEQFYEIALSKPFVDGITYSNLADRNNSVIADSGLLTDKLEPKEALQAVSEIHRAIFNR